MKSTKKSAEDEILESEMSSYPPGRYVRAPTPEGFIRAETHKEKGNRGSTFTKETNHKDDDEKDIISGWPLKPFPGNLKPEEQRHEWRSWKQLFLSYLALKKRVRSQQEKLAVLLLAGGTEIMKASQTSRSPKEIKVKPGEKELVFDNMMVRLDKHFRAEEDSILDSVLFHQMNQKQSEPFRDYVQRLRQQAAFCNFGAREETEIILRIIQGANDREEFMRMAVWHHKTLEELEVFGTAMEDSKKRFVQLKSETSLREFKSEQGTTEVAAVFKAGYADKQRNTWNPSGERNRQISGNFRGRSMAPQFRNPPYRGAYRGFSGNRGRAPFRCYNCGGSNHIARQCRRAPSQVNNVEENSRGNEEDRKVNGNDWMV